MGWLVPELSLLLHVAYAALLEHCPDLDALYHLHYARRLADGGEAALQAIQECEAIILWSTEEDDKKKTFGSKTWSKTFSSGSTIENKQCVQGSSTGSSKQIWIFEDGTLETYVTSPQFIA